MRELMDKNSKNTYSRFSVFDDMIKNLLYPSKNTRLFVLMIPMTNVILIMMPAKHYINTRTKVLYPIYSSEELTENVINLILNY